MALKTVKKKGNETKNCKENCFLNNLKKNNEMNTINF